jgi:hypothetical protein
MPRCGRYGRIGKVEGVPIFRSRERAGTIESETNASTEKEAASLYRMQPQYG